MVGNGTCHLKKIYFKNFLWQKMGLFLKLFIQSLYIDIRYSG